VVVGSGGVVVVVAQGAAIVGRPVVGGAIRVVVVAGTVVVGAGMVVPVVGGEQGDVVVVVHGSVTWVASPDPDTTPVVGGFPIDVVVAGMVVVVGMVVPVVGGEQGDVVVVVQGTVTCPDTAPVVGGFPIDVVVVGGGFAVVVVTQTRAWGWVCASPMLASRAMPSAATSVASASCLRRMISPGSSRSRPFPACLPSLTTGPRSSPDSLRHTPREVLSAGCRRKRSRASRNDRQSVTTSRSSQLSTVVP
jgi:hypothetical protein